VSVLETQELSNTVKLLSEVLNLFLVVVTSRALSTNTLCHKVNKLQAKLALIVGKLFSHLVFEVEVIVEL
jgi:hypothetical protein